MLSALKHEHRVKTGIDCHCNDLPADGVKPLMAAVNCSQLVYEKPLKQAQHRKL